jgi:hypothetical protein
MGGPDASLSGHGCKMPVNLGGRPMSWSLFYLCLKLRICFQSWFFGWLWHVLPVPSCIAVCLSRRCTGLGWSEMRRWYGLWGKGGFPVCRVPPFSFFLTLLVNCAHSIWFWATMVEKGCGCACPSDFLGLHLTIKPVGDPPGLGWALRVWGSTSSDAVSLLGRWFQSLSWLGDPVPKVVSPRG